MPRAGLCSVLCDCGQGDNTFLAGLGRSSGSPGKRLGCRAWPLAGHPKLWPSQGPSVSTSDPASLRMGVWGGVGVRERAGPANGQSSLLTSLWAWP